VDIPKQTEYGNANNPTEPVNDSVIVIPAIVVGGTTLVRQFKTPNGVRVGVGVGVGVNNAGIIESVQISIAVPAIPPGPTTVNVVNGDELLIVKIPFPVEPIHVPKHTGDVFDAVIVLPLIIAQQYRQDEIDGTPLPVFVVNVNDSAELELLL
jgi:hypothetical protein